MVFFYSTIIAPREYHLATIHTLQMTNNRWTQYHAINAAVSIVG